MSKNQPFVMRPKGCSLLFAGGLLGGFAIPACGFSSAVDPPSVELSEASGEPIDAVPCVPRLVLRGAELGSLDELWLLEGEVTGATEDKLRRGEISDSIVERRVPLAAWTDGEAVHLAPTVVLEPATTYTLFAMGRGSPGVVRTSSDACEIWYRWGSAEAEPRGTAVYCASPPPWLLTESESKGADSAAEPTVTPLRVEPGGGARLARGLLYEADGCVELFPDSAEAGSGFVLPPQSFDGRWFEPSPLWTAGLGGAGGGDVGPSPERVAASSGGDASEALHVVSSGEILELELGPGLHVLEVGAASGGGERMRLVRLVEAASAVERLGPLAPGAHVLEHLCVRPDGVRERATFEFEVTAGTAEPILTEVLANPNGPEPDSEWLEIHNPSRVPRSLAGYRLHDAAGTTELPSVVLPAGGFGLVVMASYVANPALDVVPDAAAVPIVVPTIGKLGLANSGEEIRLENPAGKVVSRIPALEGKEGTSLVRKHPFAPDLATSFGAHAAPGASPGWSPEPDDAEPDDAEP